jgi:NADPH:quinone reductase-like Zn-dependent oxidoreductase
MKAAVLTSPSPIEQGPLHLEDVASPEPEPGEIVVQVRAVFVARICT